MTPIYDSHGSTLYLGDCLKVLAELPDNSIDTVITDPPYHLTTGKKGGTGAASLNPNSPAGRARIGTGGFMGNSWDGGDVAFRPETWQAVRRVCKPGAMLMAFGGTRTFHRLTCAIEDAGWEIRDCFARYFDPSEAQEQFYESLSPEQQKDFDRAFISAHVATFNFGSGFPKGVDISKAIGQAGNPDIAKQWIGWNSHLKPGFEPVVLATNPLSVTYHENAITHGVAGLNIDKCRIPADNRPHRIKTDVRDSANCYGDGLDGSKADGTTSLGRWPANVLLDEESARLMDESTGELTSGKPAGIKAGGTANCFGHYQGGIPVTGYGDSGGPSRFFYTSKASKADRGAGNTHPTVKPTDLMKWLCDLTSTPTGGVILDPFAGSGTTMVAARMSGRKCIGIELKENHCKIIMDRLAREQPSLFAA